MLGFLVLFSTLWFSRGCGTAANDQVGRCKAVSGGKYVAAKTDANGKPWKFSFKETPFKALCNAGTSGNVILSGILTDQDGVGKSGLVVAGAVSGSNLDLLEEESDQYTDACGVANFVVKWTCPTDGAFFAFSGPLYSNEVGIILSTPEAALTGRKELEEKQ